MPTIHLTTFIQAPTPRVFNLSRNISLHEKSMERSNEKAIDGITSGLIHFSETVTWQATHLFKKRILQTKITAMKPYTFFEDTMLKGDFKSLRHEHHFKPVENGTLMIDLFYFETPYKKLGELVNAFFLTRYMQTLLQKRNAIVKQYAETDMWKQVLEASSLT